MKVVSFLVLFLGICFANKIVVDLTADSTTVPSTTVVTGKDTLEVKVKGNPTTGFMWAIVNSTLLSSDGEEALFVRKMR